MIRSRNVDSTSVVKHEVLWFDTVASIGAGVANSTIQATVFLPYKARVAGIVGSAATKAGAVNPSYVVFNSAGTPAAIHAARTLAADAVAYSDDPTARSTEYAKGYKMTLRAVTNADDGAITGLKVGIVLEKRDTNE